MIKTNSVNESSIISTKSDYKGVGARLKELMKLQNVTVSMINESLNIPTPTLYRLLNEDTSEPKLSTLIALSQYFNVSVDEMCGLKELGQHKYVNVHVSTIPLISWTDVTKGPTHIKQQKLERYDRIVTVAKKLNDDCYALPSKPSFVPRFPHNTILVVDPHKPIQDGCLAVIEFNHENEATLKHITKDGNRNYITSIVDQQRDILDENAKVLGVVVYEIYSHEL